ncbi:MAG: NnrS family protein [Xanthomonadales bacterium]|nr:NnrS family protein [Xanthomonadales bacterium]
MTRSSEPHAPPSPFGLLPIRPHRLLFAAGAVNLCLSMAWWAVALFSLRWGLAAMPQTPLYSGWVHAFVWPYFVLAPFLFGFLLTVFPRWMSLTDYTRWDYVPIALGLASGQLLVLGAPWLGGAAMQVGLLFGAAAWLFGWLRLLDRLRQDRTACWHARSAALAIAAGVLGMVLLLLHGWTGELRWMTGAIKLGLFGVLLPLYLTVAHRMFPFFANSVDRSYVMWRPTGLLGMFWGYCFAHGVLDWIGAARWLWMVDLPMALCMATVLRRWWPKAGSPLILRALFLGMLWLPTANLLFAAQSLIDVLWNVGMLGRAPTHALTIGLFGSLLIAMVTRVSRGHSGRMLEMGPIDRAAFFAMHALAASRIAAELGGDPLAWSAWLAVAWVLVIMPWMAQGLFFWSTPRVDGKPG